uniref:Uncharacterized protein n=1 Tax=Daphnia galeata TaxID=27404 RepID=A0A8J2RQV6_9CRUS|nr:unnamed protein product [Daphnia galeata]
MGTPKTQSQTSHDIAQTELETDGEGTTPETGQQTEETPRQQPDAQPDEQTRRYPENQTETHPSNDKQRKGTPPHLAPPVHGDPHDDLGAHRQLSSQSARNAASSQHTIHVQATDMFHQMQWLSDLEHTRIRDQDMTSRSRYPWEWIVGFILFISVAGFLVKSTHCQYASQHHVLAVQMFTSSMKMRCPTHRKQQCHSFNVVQI